MAPHSRSQPQCDCTVGNSCMHLQRSGLKSHSSLHRIGTPGANLRCCLIGTRRVPCTTSKRCSRLRQSTRNTHTRPCLRDTGRARCTCETYPEAATAKMRQHPATDDRRRANPRAGDPAQIGSPAQLLFNAESQGWPNAVPHTHAVSVRAGRGQTKEGRLRKLECLSRTNYDCMGVSL